MLLALKNLILQGLPRDKAEAFAAAFPVDVDAPDVCDKLAILRLTRMLPTLDANPERYAKECAIALRLAIDSLSAAESAESAARSAAESAAWSAAESAARSAHFEWEAATLLQLLRDER